MRRVSFDPDRLCGAYMLLLASLALATPVHEALGWTDEGQFVYTTVEHHVAFPPDSRSESDSVDTRSVFIAVDDGATGSVHRWLVEKNVPEPIVDDRPLETAAWEAWLTAHPLSPTRATYNLPHGVRVVAGPEAAGWQCEDGLCRVSRGPNDEAAPDAALFLTRDGDGSWPLMSKSVSSTPWGPLHYTARIWPSPDGRRVAVDFSFGEAWTMRGAYYDTGSPSIRLAAPLIGVLAPDGLADARRRVAEALTSGRFGLVNTGPAQAERARTVVYFSDGFADDAQRIAAAVPGGADVEPMTWSGAQHVVVAVGASAR